MRARESILIRLDSALLGREELKKKTRNYADFSDLTVRLTVVTSSR